jgi:hypothetical protein
VNVRTQTGALTARWSILMVLVVAVLVGGFSVWSALKSRAESRHVQAQFDCVARYNGALQERSVILTKIAAEDRQNITDLVKGVSTAQSGPQAEKALKAYLDRNVELERRRAAQPFPATPEKACT